METSRRRWAGLLIGLLSMAMIVLFGGALAAQAAGTLMVNGQNILTAANNTVQCGSGTAVYDVSSNTLTLTNATMNTTNDECIYADGINLTVQVVGTNTLTADMNVYTYSHDDSACILYKNGTLTIVGDDNAILDITCTGSKVSAGILGDGNGLTINGPTVRVTVPDTAIAGIYAFGANYWVGEPITIMNANVTVSAAECAIGVNGKNLTIQNSKVNCTSMVSTVMGGDVIIEDSEVHVKDTIGTEMYFHQGNISIKGDSDVIAERGFSSSSLTIIPTDGQQMEFLGGDTESTAQQVKDSPFDSEYTYGSKSSFWYRYSRIRQVKTEGEKEPYEEHRPCHHRYEWDITKTATAIDDGVMKYRCKYCGKVEYEVPISAYYVFNKDTQEAILKAEQGATVTVQTPLFISFHEMVKNALQERPDVTLVVDYKNAGKLYEMTIPAGSGDQLETLFGESQFAGFLYLGGVYATTELLADTQFTNIPSELMWFGTTNAH